MTRCDCILCLAQSGGQGQDVRQLVQTIETTDPERAEVLGWFIEHEYAPISLDELPAPNDQLFWDALGVLALSNKFVYEAGNSSLEVGEGKIVVKAAGGCREYECINQIRADAQNGDPVAAAGVRLAESAVRYRHADREDYQGYRRFAYKDLAVEVNLDEEVVHVWKGHGKIYEIYEYSLEEFLAFADLVLEAQEWVRKKCD